MPVITGSPTFKAREAEQRVPNTDREKLAKGTKTGRYLSNRELGLTWDLLRMSARPKG
jgi:hypothetical protein